MFVRLSAAVAALSILGSAALAQGAKPTDPQIAHIAYTAGVIDIAAAKQAIGKAGNKLNRTINTLLTSRNVAILPTKVSRTMMPLRTASGVSG